MNQYKINKDDVLQATDGGLDIIRYYISDIDQYIGKSKKFALREEKTPSCTIKRLTDGNYVVTDFGADGKPMNGIAFVRKMENCEFGEAIKIIAERHGIGSSEQIKSMYEAEVSSTDAAPDQLEKEWYFQYSNDISENHLRILFSDRTWTYIQKQVQDDKGKDTPIAEVQAEVQSRLRKILTKQHWHALDSYTIIKGRKAITFSASEFYPIFAIEEEGKNGRFIKVYQPKSKDKGKRFFYYGEFDKNFLHGWQQVRQAYEDLLSAEGQYEDENNSIARKLEDIFYCTGGSDALNLYALGYNVVYPSSEHFKLTKDHVYKFFAKAKNVYTCPDRDYTGQFQNHRLCMNKENDIFLDIRTVELPESLALHRDQYGRPCKDVRDFLKYYSAKDFQNLVRVAMMYRFWDSHQKISRNGEPTMKFGKPVYEFKLSMERVLNFLRKNGFGRRKVNEEAMEFIQIDGNLVRQVKPEDIKVFLLSFLRSRYMPEDLLNVLHRSPMLSSTSFESLPELDPDFRDFDSKSQYLFFQNTNWRITAEGIEELRTEQLTKMVWESKIIKHKVKKLDKMFDVTTDEQDKYRLTIHNQQSPLMRFMIQTSRVHWRKELEERLDHLPQEEIDAYKAEHKFDIAGPNLTADEQYEQTVHLLNKMYAFGYLCHRYKSRSNSWIVYGMDEAPANDDRSQGGTGKSILFLAVAVLKNVLLLDGKDKDLFADKHVFENVTTNTDVIYIDDADRKFPMERTFSMTTGDITVNPKGTRRTQLKFADAPKLGVTTNFSPDDLSDSVLRRLLFFACSNYYHTNASGRFREKLQPKDEFGFEFWDEEYSAENWNLDFNFMAQCIQLYLSRSKWIEAPMQNLMNKSLVNSMGFNFVAWADVFFAEESGRLNAFISTSYAIQDYFNESGIKITPNGFNGKLREYAQLKRLNLNPSDLLNKDGRIIKNYYEFKYDQRNTKYVKSDSKKTQSFFYLQQIGKQLTDEIFDPTVDRELAANNDPGAENYDWMK